MSTPLKKIKTATQDPELKQIFDQKNINNIFNSFILGDEGKTIIDSLLADYTSTTQEEPPHGFSLGSFKKIGWFWRIYHYTRTTSTSPTNQRRKSRNKNTT
jgi:hypothetical protein